MDRRVSSSEIKLIQVPSSTESMSPKLIKLHLQQNIVKINTFNSQISNSTEAQKEIDKHTLNRINSREYAKNANKKARKVLGDILLLSDDELSTLLLKK